MLRATLILSSCLLTLPALASPPAPSPVDPWCVAISKRLRSVPLDTCRNLGFTTGDVRTPGDRPLVLRDVPPPATPASPAGKTNAPRVLVIGGIHGDELTSSSIVFRWLQWTGEADASLYHWRVIPLANPDGLLASPPTRVNGRGVDLNRNFPTPDWDKDAHNYWTQRAKRDPRRYPGKTAGSEIETRWLEEQIREFKPDVIISVHAPYSILDYDGPAPKPHRFGRLNLNQLGVYPGSLGNYSGIHQQTPVVTIELPSATSMPTIQEQRAIWQDMLAWMKKNIIGQTRS